ncbi:BON domain-containing protein [Sulfurimonas sp.]
MADNKKTVNEEDALENALSPVVNRLIDKNFENSGDKIASQIAPLIGGAIREQIKSQKDDIVDALYPVMGSMISKFVTKSLEELLSKINEQIQNGLSTQAIKRKIKAKIKGVSETELLLQENSEANIKAVLLIHKESGLLLAKAQNEQEHFSDTDMLASMMTAIRSFVNDWVESGRTNSELGEIEYGGNKIIIEASGYSYLAVIVEGAAYAQTYEKIRFTLEKIVLKYAEYIKEFDGNFETFPKEEITLELESLLHQETPEEANKASKTHPVLIILPLLLISYIAWYFYSSYVDEALQNKIQNRLSHTPQLTPFRIDTDVDNGKVTLNGKVPFSYHKELAQQELKNFKDIKELHNNIQVIPTLTDPLQVSANIAYLLKGINFNKGTNISYAFDYNKLTLNGYTANKKLLQKLLQELQNISGIQTVENRVVLKKIKINANLYFDTASTQLNNASINKLTDIAQKLKKSDINATIELKAYSDMIGNKETNRALAKKRIQTITNFLQEKVKLTNPIQYQIFDTPPASIDAKKEPKKARRITLQLKAQKK